MVAHGHVQNGVVVLDDGVRLPEGQEVTVRLWTRILRLAGTKKSDLELDRHLEDRPTAAD